MAVIVKRLGYRYVQNGGGGGGTGIAERYLRSFDVPNWTLSSEDYILTIPFSQHAISANPTTKVYLDNGSTFEEVIVPVFVNSSGDITITVSSSPDNRFKGKIVIL